MKGLSHRRVKLDHHAHVFGDALVPLLNLCIDPVNKLLANHGCMDIYDPLALQLAPILFVRQVLFHDWPP